MSAPPTPHAVVLLIEPRPGFYAQSGIHSRFRNCALLEVPERDAVAFVCEHKVDIVVVAQGPGYKNLLGSLKEANSDLFICVTLRDPMSQADAKEAGADETCIGISSRLVDAVQTLVTKITATVP